MVGALRLLLERGVELLACHAARRVPELDAIPLCPGGVPGALPLGQIVPDDIGQAIERKEPYYAEKNGCQPGVLPASELESEVQ
jgi:hypothetical protein